MDLAAVCEVLQATQSNDDAIRKGAEQKLQEAQTNTLDQLIEGLMAVLVAGNTVAAPLRQQAAVLLRRRIDCDWDDLQEVTRKAVTDKILATVEDTDQSVSRSVGTVVSATAEEVCRNFAMAEDEDVLNYLMKVWPGLLPWLATKSGSSEGDPFVRHIALNVLSDLAPHIGEDMLQKGQVKDVLARALQDQSPLIRASGVKLILKFIEHLPSDSLEKVKEAMPAVISVVRDLTTSSTEKELKTILDSLVRAAESEPDFFFQNSFQALFETLMTICNADAAIFSEPEIIHSAMEAIMSLAEGNSDEEVFTKQYLEPCIELNFSWLLRLEQDVDAWTAVGKEEDDNGEIDGDDVRIAEENFDRLGTHFDEDELIPLMFKTIHAKCGSQADWTMVRSAILSIAQVVEHCDDDDRIDQCVDFVIRFHEHPHPRVRCACYDAISQCVLDQEDRFEAKYVEDLVPKVLTGLRDGNIRVVMAAANVFTAMSDILDYDDISEHLPALLETLFAHLDKGESRRLQQVCIDCIGVAASAAEEGFKDYYDQVMPLLKQIIKAGNQELRLLCAKAFRCASYCGKAVGKEAFLKDAHELMNLMLPMFQQGFAAEDESREFLHEAANEIITTIGKEFKPYVSALLPSILGVLRQKPKTYEEILEDEDEDEIVLNELGDFGLRSSVLEEMDEAMEMILELITALEEEFSEFIKPICEVAMPLLDYPMGEDVRETLFKLWGMLAKVAQAGAQCGRLDPTILRELVTGFLTKTLGDLGKGNPADVHENCAATCSKYEILAKGASNVIKQAGPGVLTSEALMDVAKVAGQLLAAIEVTGDSLPDGKRHKKRDPEMIDEDEDGEESDDEEKFPTPQSVRFALADIMTALMRTNTEEFAQQVLPSFMELATKFLKDDASISDADRHLAYYICEGVTDAMGDKSLPYWNFYINPALSVLADKPGKQAAPIVKQYAAKVLGTAAKQQAFKACAINAAQSVFSVLQKHLAKYKRRRVKPEQNPQALAIDSCVRALGLICEHHEQAFQEDHKPMLWSMWISSLPIKYDAEVGQQVHAQLLSLMAREHPAIVDPTKLPGVLMVLLDVYKTKQSTADLNKNIASAIVQIGPEKLEALSSGFKDTHKKRIESILKKDKTV
jgi:hypothetical protein